MAAVVAGNGIINHLPVHALHATAARGNSTMEALVGSTSKNNHIHRGSRNHSYYNRHHDNEHTLKKTPTLPQKSKQERF